MHGVVTSSAFDRFVMSLIVLNTVALAIVHYDEPDEMTKTLDIAEIVFTLLFVLEAVLKLLGLGFYCYFTQGSNVFDFVITVLSFVSLFDIGASGFSAMRVLRVFRALRVARILRRFPVIMRSHLCIL